MMVRTSRFWSALAAVVVAVLGWVSVHYFAHDPTTKELIAVVAMVLEGLAVPAAAAPVGTIDATLQPARTSRPRERDGF